MVLPLTTQCNRSETVSVDAILENPGLWSQTFVLVPATQENGNFTLSFPVDLDQYNTLLNNIIKETGTTTQSSYNLTIEANVHLTGQTSVGPVDQTFSDSIVTALGSGVLTWTGKLEQSNKGTISTTTSVQTPAKIWGIQATTIPSNIDYHPGYRPGFTGLSVPGSCQKG